MQCTFRCRESGHLFIAEGNYSQFDQARKCPRCCSPAFMLIESMAAMHGPDSATARADRAAYAEHNVCFTSVRNQGQIKAEPVSHSVQCGCENCGRHRRRALITEVADAPSRKTAGKEVRL